MGDVITPCQNCHRQDAAFYKIRRKPNQQPEMCFDLIETISDVLTLWQCAACHQQLVVDRSPEIRTKAGLSFSYLFIPKQEMALFERWRISLKIPLSPILLAFLDDQRTHFSGVAAKVKDMNQQVHEPCLLIAGPLPCDDALELNRPKQFSRHFTLYKNRLFHHEISEIAMTSQTLTNDEIAFIKNKKHWQIGSNGRGDCMATVDLPFRGKIVQVDPWSDYPGGLLSRDETGRLDSMAYSGVVLITLPSIPWLAAKT